MDFRFGPEAEALRATVRAELPNILSPSLAGEGMEFEHDPAALKQFSKELAKRGWLVPHWPKEWGGSEMPLDQQAVLTDELVMAAAPISINMNRCGYTGPTIIHVGTDEQKKRHLPGIASGEVMWAQGFSEPGAGSDLAALSTRAVRHGDGYIINGQKIWTSYAHFSDWMILLARTDPDAPKHRGISFFLLDMHSPGVTVRPLYSPAGVHHLNEVFFEDVFVPRENLVGEENRGWYVATATLDFERASVATMGHVRRQLLTLRQALERSPVRTRQQEIVFADLAIGVEVSMLLCHRVLSMQMKGLIPNAESSAAKLFTSEIGQRISYLGPGLLGLRGNLMDHSLEGRIAGGYIGAIVATIGGGTSEVQRSIMATRGLGLPRG